MAKRSDDLGAWEAYQRGMWHMSVSDADTIGDALRYFQFAISLDPRLGPSYSDSAWAQAIARCADPVDIFSRSAGVFTK